MQRKQRMSIILSNDARIGYGEMESIQKGDNVSLGQTIALTIARAVVSDRILILDEATSSVDTRLWR